MVVLLVFGLVALGMWIACIITAVQVSRSSRGGIKVRAEVTGFSHYTSRGQTMYSPIYRAVVDGQTVTGTSTMAKNWQSPRVGTLVTMLYNRENAEAPLTELGIVRYILPMIFGGMAILFTTTCIGPLISMSLSGSSGGDPPVDSPSGAHHTHPAHEHKH